MLKPLIRYIALICFCALPLSVTPLAFSENADCVRETSVAHIEGGSFIMGHDRMYSEEGKARQVVVDPFWIDTTEVTVSQFKEFVRKTNYITVAEKKRDPLTEPDIDLENSPELSVFFEPGGAVFVSSKSLSGGWKWVPQASWRRPQGPSEPEAAPFHPVTQIAYQDACDLGWRSTSNGAEWEFAALAGRSNSEFGASVPEEANTWQGIFPVVNTKDDGFDGVAPVGCFAPNALGLYDMTAMCGSGQATGTHQGIVLKQRIPKGCQRHRVSIQQIPGNHHAF